MGLSLETLVTVCNEELVWLARYGAPHVTATDLYTGTLTIVRREQSKGYIFGAAGPVITHAERRTLTALLQAKGITQARWIRKRLDGQVHNAELEPAQVAGKPARG